MRSVAIETLFGAAGATEAAGQVAKPKTSLWARFATSIIAARTVQAKALVARHLAHESDATLRSIGWTDAEIADLRRRTH